jgi:hypothetical protein
VLSPAPVVDWNFRNGSLDSSLTFTRASIGTYFDATRTLVTAAAGVPRFDHDPSTGIALGLLMEEQRTNLLLYSGDLSRSSWGKSNCTVTQGVVLAPDGTMTGNVVTRTAVGNHYLYQNVTATPASTAYSFSVWLRAGTYSGGVRVWIKDGSGTSLGAVDVTPTSSWTRYSFSGTFPSTAAANIGVYIDPDNDTGVAGDTFYVWGAQLEAGAFPTSYIPTTTAAVTRSADMLSCAAPTWLASGAATVIADAQQFGASSVAPRVWELANSSGDLVHMIAKGQTSQYAAESYVSAVYQASIYASGTFAVGTRYRSAFAFATDNFACSVGGSTVGKDAAGSIPTFDSASTLWLGSNGTTSRILNGWLRRFTYLNYVLDATPLAQMSAS